MEPPTVKLEVGLNGGTYVAPRLEPQPLQVPCSTLGCFADLVRARADPQHRLRMKLAGKPLEDCAHAPNEEELLAEKMALTLIAEEEMERERARAQRDAASP